MKMENTNLLKQIADFAINGKVNCQSEVPVYFYDWSCRDSQLEAKANRLMKQTIQFIKSLPSGNIDLENTYVFFKNNCPLNGELYDDFRICDLVGDVIFIVVPKTGHHDKDFHTAEVWGYKEDGDFDLLVRAKDFKNLLFASNVYFQFRKGNKS
jgi:hypothetical protein